MSRKKILVENPIVAATVNHMTQMHLQNPQTGRRIKATTPLRNPNHPLHNTSVSIFKKIKDKLTPKKKHEPDIKDYTPTQSDTDFYRKQFAGRSGEELKEDWWDDMSPENRAQYIQQHPQSQKAQDAKKEKGDDKPKYEPSADDYDAIYGTRNQAGGGWQKPRDDKPDDNPFSNDPDTDDYEDWEKNKDDSDNDTQSQDPFNPPGMSPDDPMFYDPEAERRRRKKFARTGKELTRKEAKQYIKSNKDKFTEDVIRRIIRQEIKEIVKQ